VNGQTSRYRTSAVGMVGALLILLAVIAAFLVMRELVRTTPETPVRAVDYQETVRYAGDRASFDVLAPPSLPTGWRATSASYTPAPEERWHLGVLTEDGEYVGIEQELRSVESMVEEYVDQEAVAGERIELTGATGPAGWTTYRDDSGDHALVRREGDLTTLVVGTADQRVLVDYVQSLE